MVLKATLAVTCATECTAKISIFNRSFKLNLAESISVDVSAFNLLSTVADNYQVAN